VEYPLQPWNAWLYSFLFPLCISHRVLNLLLLVWIDKISTECKNNMKSKLESSETNLEPNPHSFTHEFIHPAHWYMLRTSYLLALSLDKYEIVKNSIKYSSLDKRNPNLYRTWVLNCGIVWLLKLKISLFFFWHCSVNFIPLETTMTNDSQWYCDELY
jgi:hypothetical protein